MKKILVSILLTIVALHTIIVPALAVPPSEESWMAVSFVGGVATGGYYINTTNLQVSAFWIDNNSDWPVYLWITKDGNLIFDLYTVAHSGLTEKSINNFKFQRIPATDPDDPNSIRQPQGTVIYWRYG